QPEQDDEEREVDDEVFRQQYIPQTLQQVYDIERDAETLQQGDGASLPYRGLLADDRVADGGAVQPPIASTLPAAGDGPVEAPASNEANAANDESDESGSDDDRERWSDDDARPRGKRFEDKDEKKAHKASVKEEKRERRKEKMPKHVKKKLVNQGSRGKK
ncbi:hypothetical protein B0A55_11305, partial [Friedmanniomyces simplex]